MIPHLIYLHACMLLDHGKMFRNQRQKKEELSQARKKKTFSSENVHP